MKTVTATPLEAQSQQEPVAIPKGWKFSVTVSDGRVWLHTESPAGAHAATSAAHKLPSGAETVAAQVLLYLRDCLSSAPPQATQPAQSQQEPDMRAVCEALGFDPTNHHNAAKCPYCRPVS